MAVQNKLKDKYGPWALVAGASEGLGAAFAEELASAGLNLILLARRGEKLNLLADRLRAESGIETETIAFDLGDREHLGSLLSSLTHEIGLLVYNAAAAPIGPFLTTEPELQGNVADVNVAAPLLLTRELGRLMAEKKRGGILLMSSLAGFQGSPGISAYSASKAFNIVLAEGLWAELGDLGVDVTACYPGAVRTPGYVEAGGGKEAPGTLDAAVVARQALRHLGKGPLYIPGGLNRFFHVVLSRLLSRKTAVTIMEKNTRSLS